MKELVRRLPQLQRSDLLLVIAVLAFGFSDTADIARDRSGWSVPIAVIGICHALLWVAVYTLAARSRSPHWAWLLALGVLLLRMGLTTLLWPHGPSIHSVITVDGSATLAVLLLGLSSRYRREWAADRARAAERARIAREMHDGVSHRISHMVLRAGGLEVNAARGAAWVEQEAGAIRAEGAEAMRELRDIVRVFRQERDGAALSPQPSLRDLEPLVEHARQTGVDVVLEINGDRPPLPPQTERDVYQIVRESLTNVMKHARGSAVRVRVDQTPSGVDLRIVNGPGGERRRDLPSGGQGLIGMTERVRLAGGVFEAGRRPDGGYEVHAVFPACKPDR